MGSVLEGSVFKVTVYDLRWPHKPNPKNGRVKPKPKIKNRNLQWENYSAMINRHFYDAAVN